MSDLALAETKANEQVHAKCAEFEEENISSLEDPLGSSFGPCVLEYSQQLAALEERKAQHQLSLETLIQDSFQQIELVINKMMQLLHEKHGRFEEEFLYTAEQVSESLRLQSRIEKKLAHIATILSDEDEKD